MYADSSTAQDCFLGVEPSYFTPSSSPFTACNKSTENLINTSTGEVLRSNQCERKTCPACTPDRCLRVARHTGWALSGVPFVWSVTISPVDPDPLKSSRAVYRFAARLRAYGEVGYMYAVEEAGQVHAHILMWSDYDVRPYVSQSRKVVVKRVTDTYADRVRVAAYLTKTVHKDHKLEEHLKLNTALFHTSHNFWPGFLDYKHVRSEYRRQAGWRIGAVPE